MGLYSHSGVHVVPSLSLAAREFALDEGLDTIAEELERTMSRLFDVGGAYFFVACVDVVVHLS